MGSLRPIAWQIEELDEVPSTQDVARQLAEEGAPEGTVVVASSQLQGRGRGGRTWSSPRGGLYMSLVLRPPIHPNAQLLSLVGALSVVLGLKSSTGIGSAIRWPNDVVINGRKIAGVIVEANYVGQKLSCAIVGIGVNCNSKPSIKDLPESDATSLTEELHRPIEVTRVRAGILETLQSVYTRWLEGADVVREAEGFIGTLGMRVRVSPKSGAGLTCDAIGLTASGALIVASAGKRVLLNAEDVERLKEIGPADARPRISNSRGGSEQ